MSFMTGTAGVLRQAALTMATAAAVALIASQAHAIAVGVLSSSYTITHNSGFGTPEITDSFGPAAIPAWPPAIQYNQTLVDGNNSSSGAGGAATFVSPFLVGLGFPGGTGVSQDWVDAPAHTAAELIIDFTVTYQVVGGFGPPTYSFANFLLGGNVSNGGWVRFSYNATFTGNPGGVIGGPLGGVFFNDTPGAFLVPLSEFIWNPNGGVIGDGTIGLVGQIKFEAFDGFNHDSSGMELIETSAVGPVPLPAALPMLAAAVGALALIRRLGDLQA